MLRTITALAAALLVLTATAVAHAGPIGERHLVAHNPTAALRDAGHSDAVRVTVWYPAAAGSQEASLDIGPPGAPLFRVGSAAPDAAFADARKRSVVLLSHGFGGAARIMGWFGTALARAGFVVIAVDHPGNNGLDKMTIPGSTMFWDRPGDLAAGLAAAKADPAIGPHLDLGRLGVAGRPAASPPSQRPAPTSTCARFQAFCRAHPADGVCCAPQKEFAFTQQQAQARVRVAGPRRRSRLRRRRPRHPRRPRRLRHGAGHRAGFRPRGPRRRSQPPSPSSSATPIQWRRPTPTASSPRKTCRAPS